MKKKTCFTSFLDSLLSLTIANKKLAVCIKGAVATPHFFDSIHSFDRVYFFTYILKFLRSLDVPDPSSRHRKIRFLTKNWPLGVPSPWLIPNVNWRQNKTFYLWIDREFFALSAAYWTSLKDESYQIISRSTL